MIKKLRVTVDGKSYEVTAEVPDESGVSSPAPPPLIRSPASPPPISAVSPITQQAQTSAGPGDVRSPLAGRIVAINVQPGQEVKEGDHILTVEAMKMNTAVTAPKTGKISAVLTTVGAAVDEGQVLARIEDLK